MGSNKPSLGATIILSAAITATITIPMTVNFKKNNSVNNSNEMNVTIDGSSYEVSADAIANLIEQNQELTNENENLRESNKELQETIDNLQEKLNNDSEDTDSETDPEKNLDVLALNMEPFHSNRAEFNMKQIKDRLGNEFDTAIVLGHIQRIDDQENRDYNLEYYLDSNFSRVTGTLAFSEDNTQYMSEQVLYLNIYADGNLVEKYGPIDEKTDPIKFDISIPNPEFIEFIAYTSENKDWSIAYDVELIVDELQFHK